MFIFSFFKNLFLKHEKSKEEYSVVFRRGYEIILPKSFYNMCKEKDYCLSIVFDKKKRPTSVQVTYIKDGKKTYIGTVKKMLSVAKFKNKNVCDFTKENIVERKK